MIRWLSAAAYQDRLSAREWRRISATFALVALPLFFFLPSVLGVLLGCAIALKFFAITRHNEQLALWGAIALMVLGTVALYTYLPVSGVTLSFVALLVVMSVCKLLEARNRRDVHVLFLLQILLMLAFLMYSQSILIFFYLLFALGISTHGLLRFEQLGRQRLQFARWRDLVRLFAIALPFAAAMFFLFPRVQPLWRITQQKEGAVTGLPDDMQMGDLSSLAQSNEIAFRVKFADGKIPAANKLYWRGPILWHFDGKRWSQREGEQYVKPHPFDYKRESVVHYELTPVKSTLKWLTALDLPLVQHADESLIVGWSYQMPIPKTPHGVTANRFNLTSALDYQLSLRLTRRDQQDGLQLPESLFIPKTQGLAQRLFRENGNNARAFAEAFLNYLHNEEFYYSLEPPPGAGDPEIFLFRDRIGFCEHYSNAMVLAARSVGIPARVVIGYQGGEMNPFTGDWIVREESAHAWAELWIAGEGWVRFDPTAAVAPDRIQQGRLSQQTLTAGEDNRAFISRIAENIAAIAWLRNAMDATQAFWQDWVIDLDQDQQQALLKILGLQKYGAVPLVIILILLLLTGGSLVYWLWTRRPRSDEDAVARLLRRKLLMLEKHGYSKATSESVALFFRRIAEKTDMKQRQYLLAAADSYERLRYRGDDNATHLLSLLKQIRF
ncbi:MAG: DUF3488 and transglutaminase-like domain-containing protein [Cardiobacteriaceae bacterium]|nr:DUF3488 and transglutaminase-like domain-containing protein [Cardiobacteriaceae bacterium]